MQQEVRNGRIYFFHAQPKEEGKVHRQVVNSSPEIMQGLLRGNYLKCEIAALERDVRLLQYLQAHFREYSPRELLQKMPKRPQNFSPELFFRRQQTHGQIRNTSRVTTSRKPRSIDPAEGFCCGQSRNFRSRNCFMFTRSHFIMSRCCTSVNINLCRISC